MFRQALYSTFSLGWEVKYNCEKLAANVFIITGRPQRYKVF
jgi:hypothetical protein